MKGMACCLVYTNCALGTWGGCGSAGKLCFLVLQCCCLFLCAGLSRCTSVAVVCEVLCARGCCVGRFFVLNMEKKGVLEGFAWVSRNSQLFTITHLGEENFQR